MRTACMPNCFINSGQLICSPSASISVYQLMSAPTTRSIKSEGSEGSDGEGGVGIGVGSSPPQAVSVMAKNANKDINIFFIIVSLLER